jgi:hypothetical protein
LVHAPEAQPNPGAQSVVVAHAVRQESDDGSQA